MPPGENAVQHSTKSPPHWQAFFPDSLSFLHSCPKSVPKKAGGREAKLRRKKKTKMEIEFWGASY